jgi:hypothetical protein
VRFDAATQGGGAAPGGNNREIQINENGVFGANNRFVFDPTTGFLGVGTSSQYRPMNRWEFMSETADTVGTSLVHTNYNSGASPVAAFTARGSRGTQANPLPVLNNDTLGTISFSGFDGASFPLAAPAFIRGFAGENWSSEARGAGIQFFTTPVGSTARTERLRLDGNGQLIFPVAGGTILGANASGQDSQGGSIRIVAGAGSGGPLEGSDGNVIIAAAASNWGIGLIGAPNNGFVPDGPNSFVLYSPPSNIIALANYDGHEALLNMSLLTSHKTFTFPNATGTLALLQSEQTWTGVNTFSKGSAATTTVNFGETGNTTSRVCFNTKDVDGNDVSFYIANDTLKVEHNICR